MKTRLHKIVEGSTLDEHGLPNVQDFRRALADNVNTQDILGFSMEEELQSARGVPADLASR